MVVIKKTLHIDTDSKFQIVDLTNDINKILQDEKVNEGIINIFTKHSTSAICINENESGLLEDFKLILDEIIPNKNYKHDHIDNNAKSHLQSFLLKSSETVPVYNKQLDLGTWQSIFFVELDGPRLNRNINLTIMGFWLVIDNIISDRFMHEIKKKELDC